MCCEGMHDYIASHEVSTVCEWNINYIKSASKVVRVPDQVVAGCHCLHTGVRLHTSTDIQSLLHTQEHQSGSKQEQN